MASSHGAASIAATLRTMPSSSGGSLLDWFYQLVDTDGPTRHSAAVDIVEHLRAAQRAHDDSAGGPSAGKCPDLEYALKRLVRGLVSPRDCALAWPPHSRRAWACGLERLPCRALLNT